MLEGLEVTISSFLEITSLSSSFRLDSEFFKKEYLLADDNLKLQKSHRLSQVTTKIDVGYVGAMTSFYRDEGVALIQTKNISEFFLNDFDVIKITEAFHKSLKKSQIHFEDILIARSGSFGKASLYLEKDELNSSDIIIIQANTTIILPHYLVTFLNTKSGVQQMIRFASGGLQGHVNLTILEELKVPIFSLSFQLFIKNIIQIAYNYKKSSELKFVEAENILLETLGLNQFQPSNEAINIKSFKGSFGATGRLDAEYYQKKYDSIFTSINSYCEGVTSIRNEFELVKETSNKILDEYIYTEIGDIDISSSTVNFNLINKNELPDNAKFIIRQGHILISKVRPNRGAVGIVRDNFHHHLASGAFTILKENGIIKKEVLQVALRSSVYKELIMKYNVGSSYPVVKDEDILNLPLPKLNHDIQKQIVELVNESFRLKTESEQLLEMAKRAVEMAIEEGEDKAMEWMESSNIATNKTK